MGFIALVVLKPDLGKCQSKRREEVLTPAVFAVSSEEEKIPRDFVRSADTQMNRWPGVSTQSRELLGAEAYCLDCAETGRPLVEATRTQCGGPFSTSAHNYVDMASEPDTEQRLSAGETKKPGY